MVTVTGGSSKRVSLAALIAIKPGQHPRLIYRVHKSRRGKDQRKGFTEADYVRLLGAAHQQLAGSHPSVTPTTRDLLVHGRWLGSSSRMNPAA